MQGQGMDWGQIIGSVVGAAGNIGGGFAGRSSSSDGFSKKGAGEQALFEYGSAPLRAATLLRFAKEAGLHPLAVIGSGAQSSPVIQGQPGDNSAIGDGVARAFKGMGQDIYDSKMRNADQLTRDLNNLRLAVDIENEELKGQLLTEEINRIRNPPAPDPTPIGQVKTVDKQILPTQPGNASQEAGTEPMYQWRTTDSKGGQRKVLAEGMDEKFESDHVNSIIYNVENALEYLKNILHNPGSKGAPPKSRLPKGYTHWKYSPINKTWYPAKGKRMATNRRIVNHMNRTLDSF